jgi:hypothetical protein
MSYVGVARLMHSCLEEAMSLVGLIKFKLLRSNSGEMLQ